MTDSSSSPLHWLHGIASELDGLRSLATENLNRRLGLPSREQFEVQRALLEDARARLDRLQEQVDALAARLGPQQPS
jgi:BMFP domain-containing protein YqiC